MRSIKIKPKMQQKFIYIKMKQIRIISLHKIKAKKNNLKSKQIIV